MSHVTFRVSSIASTAILFEGALLILALGVLIDSPLLQQVYFSWHVLAWAVLATIPPLLLLLGCTHSKWKPLVRIAREVEDNVLPLFENCSLFDFALIALVAGIAEEALFRGVIQIGLTNLMTPWGAIALTGVLFGLLHLITPTYAALAGLIGVYLGWLMILSGNLLLPIVVHVLYDFLALTHVIHRYKAQKVVL